MRFLSKPASQASSFEQIVLQHLDSAHNLARWLVRDPTLAEDVVQDAMLRALRHFDSLRGEDARAWLMRIVRNVAYTTMTARRSRNETSVDEPGADEGSLVMDIPDPGDGPEAAFARQQDLGCLERRIAALPVDLRECLVLRELEAMSYKQIAEITGVPVGTVMSRLWRARQVLSEARTDRSLGPVTVASG